MVHIMLATTTTNSPRALITGASKRVGRALALHLAHAGYDLVLHYHRSQPVAEKLAGEIRALGREAILVKADLESPDQAVHLLTNLAGNPLTLLIHNAASFERDTLATMSAKRLEAQFHTNLLSPLLLTQAFAKQLPASQSGLVIALADGMLGWSASHHFFSYAASKLAWAPLTDLLASALAPNVRMNTIALGATIPGVMDSETTFNHLAAISPLERTSHPDEVIRTVDYLLASPSITGQVIYLSAGLHLTTHRWWQPD
jgi:NAD(P)-dependent dehydrogenase (short-subunit alcohol dehydrogenase family)